MLDAPHRLKKAGLYYENHRSVEWARITELLPRPLSLNILNTFSKFISVFYDNRRKPSHEETSGEVSPFSDNVLYNLHSQVFSESFSTIIEPSICAQFFYYLNNLNYLQAKVGGAETRKFLPIPQIGGFRSISTRKSHRYGDL